MVDNTSRAVTLYWYTSPSLVCGVLSAEKRLLISIWCFSRMLISNVHKSIIVMNSIDTCFSRNVFEAVPKTRSMCFIGSKTTRLRLMLLNPIKHSCLFFKHYMNSSIWRKIFVQWRSGKNTHHPPMWPRFDSHNWSHMWVEFVVGSRPCYEGFSPGTCTTLVLVPPQKSTFPVEE